MGLDSIKMDNRQFQNRDVHKKTGSMFVKVYFQMMMRNMYSYQILLHMRRFIKVIDKYGLTELLGEGMYGKVYKGINNENNEEVAVKVIQSDKFVKNPQLEEYTLNQIKVLTDLGDTPHIVRYLDMLKTANNYYFVYQYCNGGTLEKQISHYKNTPQKVIPLAKTLTYFGEILSAFKLLTKNKIMHRDLKPDNILLHNGKIKIADFGFSKSLKSPTDLAQTMLGSPIYMAPQVLNGDPYTMKADIWSLGVVLYQMIFGVCPFQSQQIGKLIQILKAQEVKYPKPIPYSVETILRRMLVKDASKRIDWVDLFQFKITQAGELIEPQLSKNMKTVSSGLGPSSIGSSNYKGFGNSSTTIDSQQSRKSPMPVERQSQNYASSSKTQYKYSTSSTSRDYYMQLRTIANIHQRMSSAVKLSMQVLKRPPKQSFGLAYIINKMIYKEINSILDFLNKDWVSGGSLLSKNDQTLIIHFKQIAIDELIELDSNLKNFKQVVESLEGDVNMIQFKKNKYLKNFYKAYRGQLSQDEEAVVLVLQMIDFFQDPKVCKKDLYKRSQKNELLKQVQARINKLQ